MSTARTSLAASMAILEARKAQMLAGIAALTDNQRAYRPAPSSWNVLEVVDHVIRTEMGILSKMRTGVDEGRRVSLKDRLRGKAVLAVMYLPTRVSVPPQVSFLHPTGDILKLPELELKWELSRKELARFVAALSEDSLTRGICRHPVGGWMTPANTLLFVRGHLRHHSYQLARLRRAFRSLPA